MQLQTLILWLLSYIVLNGKCIFTLYLASESLLEVISVERFKLSRYLYECIWNDLTLLIILLN